MHHHSTQQDNLIQTVYQTMTEHGMDGVTEMVGVILNEAMRFEREQHLGGKPYERIENRQDYANGFKPRTLNTRMGAVDLQMPQTRSGFYPSCLDKGLRSEKALTIALAEMYVNGVSTRKVTRILEKMCGLEVSSSQVSRAAKVLDEELEKWRERELGRITHLLLDAKYIKVRVNRSVRSCALLTAFGIDEEGKRRVLGVEVSLSEAEVHWRDFLQSLTKRGMHGVEMITSDNHTGLREAREAVFNGVKWQRCQFHLQQNACKHIPRKSMQEEVHQDIRDIFNAKDGEMAEFLLEKAVDKYEKEASKLAAWMEVNIPEGLTVFTQEKKYWKKLRTTNMVERQNREIARRTKVVSIFPNEESLLRLASAILKEQDEEWMSGRAYIKQ